MLRLGGGGPEGALAMDWFEPDVPLARVCCRPVGDRWLLTLTRVTGHPPARVWAALTEPELLARWAPSVPDRPLDRVGPVLLTVPGLTGAEQRPATVLAARPGSTLVLAMPDDELGWELDGTDGGTLTTLRHTFLDPDWACELAAGWHEHLDALDRLLAGCGTAGTDVSVPVPRHLLRLAYGQQLALSTPLFDD